MKKIRKYTDRYKSQTYNIFRSFLCAWNGVYFVLKNERTIYIALFFGVFSASYFGYFGRLELSLATLTLMSVSIGMEMINTSIEYVCDMITAEYDERVRVIKDVMAGAVLIVAFVWWSTMVWNIVMIFLENFFN